MTAPAPAWRLARSRAAGIATAQRALLALAGASSAFVFMEPAPYEGVVLVTILVFAASGLSLSTGQMPLVLLVLAYGVGFAVSLVPVIDDAAARMWVVVSWYLAGSTVVFAAILTRDTAARLAALLAGLHVGALIAAAAGIAGMAGVLAGTFTLYGRARGTFEDPNVFGPFLILPALLLLLGAIRLPARAAFAKLPALAVLALALLLSFSRGAWAAFVLAGAVAVALGIATEPVAAVRRRMLLATAAAGLALVALVVAALSVDQVGALFAERATLAQSYDAGPLGRFGRHLIGVSLALDHPLGIGPRQFHHLMPEDPHNVYLNAFLSGGWLAGIAYGLMVALTLAVGLRTALRPIPWRTAFCAIYGTFAGVAALGAVIDTDHWRLFWLLVAMVWGLSVAARRPAAGEDRRELASPA